MTKVDSKIFLVADVYDNCGTRERGRRVYPKLAKFLRASTAAGREAVISFSGVTLVTPSFLDETIVRLIREEPGGLIRLLNVRDVPVRSLVRLLQSSDRDIHISQVRTGEYRVAAAAV